MIRTAKNIHNAYFDVYPNVWRHGDYIEINDHGGVKIHGRSDATLNPGGVRIGTAEIYRQVEQMDEVDDSVVIGQSWKGDVRVILFVKMASKALQMDDEVKNRIRKLIRANASPRHVPAKIIAAPDIPLHIEHEKSGTGGEENDRGKTGAEQRRLEKP